MWPIILIHITIRKLYSGLLRKTNNQFISICVVFGKLLAFCQYIPCERRCAVVYYSAHTHVVYYLPFGSLQFTGIPLLLNPLIRTQYPLLHHLIRFATLQYSTFVSLVEVFASVYVPKPIRIVNIIEWIRKPFNNLSFGVLHRLFASFMSG